MSSYFIRPRRKNLLKERVYLPGGAGGGGRFIDIDEMDRRTSQSEEYSKSSSLTKAPPVTGLRTLQHSSRTFLTYAPQPKDYRKGYAKYLDMLGFRDQWMCREEFLRDVNKHIDRQRATLPGLSSSGEALTTLVADFLLECGTFWWGEEVRGHLEEEDTVKGFLCPRDAERPDSTLKATLQQLFRYRADAVNAYRARVPKHTEVLRQGRTTSQRRLSRVSIASRSETATRALVIDLEESEPEEDLNEHILTKSPNAADSSINFPTLQGCSLGSTLISAEVIAVTTFAVSSSNRLSRGPVILNLRSLDISSDLFTTLVAECKIHPDLVQKVEDITATFPVDGRKQRIRSGKPEDLTVFYSTIQKTWQKRPNLFTDAYEVEILIHVDD